MFASLAVDVVSELGAIGIFCYHGLYTLCILITGPLYFAAIIVNAIVWEYIFVSPARAIAWTIVAFLVRAALLRVPSPKAKADDDDDDKGKRAPVLYKVT